MVIKGGARGGAGDLAAHLQRTDTNERAELRELRGVAATDLEGALREMEAVASGSQSKRHFYHASINVRADEVLTPEQWTKAIDRLERELGLVGQPRAVMAHVKQGRAHIHVAWSRIDLSTMTAISDSHNFRRHEIVARELEREFGHERVQGAHIEREDKQRPARTPNRSDIQRAERTGLSIPEATAELTGIWNRTDSGKAFAAAINDAGWILARGDRRDFVVVDTFGDAHSLVRRIDHATAADIRSRMVDVDRAALPSVDDACLSQEQRRSELDVKSASLRPDVSATDAVLVLAEVRRPAGDATSSETALRAPKARHAGNAGREHPRIAGRSGGMVAQQREAIRMLARNQAAAVRAVTPVSTLTGRGEPPTVSPVEPAVELSAAEARLKRAEELAERIAAREGTRTGSLERDAPGRNKRAERDIER